jgi:hypothetical protein
MAITINDTTYRDVLFAHLVLRVALLSYMIYKIFIIDTKYDNWKTDLWSNFIVVTMSTVGYLYMNGRIEAHMIDPNNLNGKKTLSTAVTASD